jgi:hypothetical protein
MITFLILKVSGVPMLEDIVGTVSHKSFAVGVLDAEQELPAILFSE